MVAIVNRANTIVTDLGGGRWRIAKAGGGDGAFDASAVSTAAIAGDFVLWASSSVPTISTFVAVSADPTESNGYTTLDYAAQIYHDEIDIYERGTFRPPIVARDAAVWIARIGTTLTYRTGARFGSAVLRRTVTGVTAPLYFDSSLASANSVIDVRFDPPGTWTAARRARTRATLGLGIQTGGTAT
ncbi:MAG: hypothetical protein V4537_06975 [Pseudomonadota bacterium]